MKKINVLVSAICFINRNKPGAVIYATFANRLILDVMTKTPYDIRIITNEPEHFLENSNKYPGRIIITCDKLEGERLVVSRFNQMLKYKTMKNVLVKYDWLWYMDCDTGLCEPVDSAAVDEVTERWEKEGYDMLGTRTDATVRNCLAEHEARMKEYKDKIEAGDKNATFRKTLFSDKFVFYNVTSETGPFEWMDAKMPSEHVLYIKNNEKLEKMATEFQNFNKRFEAQVTVVTVDMEAFEIGVSAKLAGYNMGDFRNEHGNIFKVRFNYNNWERVKY